MIERYIKMNNNEMREKLKNNNITTENVTTNQIAELVQILNKNLKDSGIYKGTAKADSKSLKFITMNTSEWKNRECISFNNDGFIGIAGWASTKNTKPIYDSIIQWIHNIKANNN
jgi:hypothetical protein